MLSEDRCRPLVEFLRTQALDEVIDWIIWDGGRGASNGRGDKSCFTTTK